MLGAYYLSNNHVNRFESMVGVEAFNLNTVFNGVNFHFHTPAEHVVDNVRHDMELHYVSLPEQKETGYFGGVIGVLFSVNDYTAELTDT